jgi:hypothetical protein
MPAADLQTLTLEYRVYDSCDGVTEAPPFSDGEIDERQVIVFEVQRLGRIPLRFLDAETENPDDPSAYSERFLTWTVLRGTPTSFGTYDGLNVAEVERASPRVVEVVHVGQIPSGKTGLYIRRCVRVPQGGMLTIDGIDAPAGEFAVVRLRIQQAESNEQSQMLVKACCCKENLPDVSLPAESPCPEDLTLTAVSPDSVPEASIATTIRLTGSGFAELDTVTLMISNDDTDLPVTSIVVDSDTQITATFVPSTKGTYDIVIGDPNYDGCVAGIVDGLTVT